jgi:DNA ligase (NAD+)
MGVGEATANALSVAFTDLHTLMQADEMRLQQVPDIGPVVANHIRVFFHEPHNISLIKQLLLGGVKWAAPQRTAKESPLAGKTFVITGTLTAMSREEAAEKLRALGATVSGSVSAKTYAVIVGDAAGSKYDKARQLGVHCLDEKRFSQLLEQHHEK